MNRWSQKLSEADVRVIRLELTSRTLEDIAHDFGVSRTTILHIKQCKTWRGVA